MSDMVGRKAQQLLKSSCIFAERPSLFVLPIDNGSVVMFRCELQLTTKTVELEMQAIIVYAEIDLTVYSSSTIQDVMVTRFEVKWKVEVV